VACTVNFKPSALRAIQRLPKKLQRGMIAKIELLAQNPHAAGEEKLKDYDGLYRVREGSHRVVYTRQEGKIQILLVSNRKDVYDELRRQRYR
jgi:mRNA interferase RelE/StbE